MRFHNLILVLLVFCSGALLAKQGGHELEVLVVDSSHEPVAAATVTLSDGQNVITSEETTADGRVLFSHLAGADYFISVSKAGFQPIENNAVKLSGSDHSSAEIALLPKLQHKEQIDVQGTAATVDQSSSGSSVQTSAARELPSRPATVSDALPLIPGVVRSPQGGLNISGTGEHRSALVVNSADVTDPATGQFGSTVPIDSVETLNVYQTPFLAEYGRFTSGLVSVETRRGSDTWKYELNDPFPDFRIRNYHMRGIMDATPRLNLEGPLITGKLYFSEGLEYEIRKIPVITLPFPHNQQIKEGFNSFSQFDYILSASQLITATFHEAPQHLKSVNLNAFNPEATVPDASFHDETATLAHKLTLNSGDLFENSLSYTRFNAGVWSHGTEDLIVTPDGNLGNYFAQQQRISSRTSWLSTYSLRPFSKAGTHNFKIGSYIAPSSENADISERPFTILDSAGQLLEQVSFTGGSPIQRHDLEMAFFGQDHWLISPRLSVDFGVRAESQQLTETLRVAPRAGIAWTPSALAGTVIRAGIGLFYDRVPLNVFGFAQYPEQVVTTYNGLGQIMEGPITYLNVLGQVYTRVPFVFHDRVAGNFSPRSTNWSFQVEQRLTPVLKLRASYMQNESAGVVVLNPLTPEANSSLGEMLLSGNGRSRYHQVELTGRVRLEGDKQELFVSYVKSRAQGDLNDFSNYLGNFPAPIIRPNQFGNLPGDLPNRFLTWGLLHLPWRMQIAPIFEFRTGFPYLVTNAAQAYVGIPYQQRYPDFLSCDARLSKDFKINTKYSVRLSVSGYNLTNHFNPDWVYSNTDAPLYGTFFGQRHRRFMADFDVLF